MAGMGSVESLDKGTSAAQNHRGLQLPQAIALIVGSIIGVGIFNLPASLAQYGPISILGMPLTTVGALALASMFAVMSRRLPLADMTGILAGTHGTRVSTDYEGVTFRGA